MAQTRASREELKTIEDMINTLSDHLMEDSDTQVSLKRVQFCSDLMTELQERMTPIFGRSDSELRAINKALREVVSLSSDL